MAGVTITVRKHGPYLVSGPVEVRTRKAIPTRPRKARWRSAAAAASTEKPFCDGTHSKVGFQAAERAVPGSAEG